MSPATESGRRTGGPWPPDGPLTRLPGVGPATAARLDDQGIETLIDLLLFLPRRYRELAELDRPEPERIGCLVRLRGRVLGTRFARLPGRRSMVTVDFAAADGTPFQASFFNQPWLRRNFPVGEWRTVEGVLDRRGERFAVKAGRVLGRSESAPGPVQLRYPELEGVSEARLRKWIELCLDGMDWSLVALDPLPPGLAGEDATPKELLFRMHRPASVGEHEGARRSLALREAVDLFRRVERARRARQSKAGPRIDVDELVHDRIEARIPFSWTEDQAGAVDFFRRALAGPSPMGVLLQGDVGTGKTAVAVYAALAAVARGFQVAFLAPTELLAEQHFEAVGEWLRDSRVRLALLTGGLKEREQCAVREDLLAGDVDLVFGTHALLSESTAFSRLGLVVIDEQHRFGVGQRMRILHKGTDPHVLVMTATPIPRTLALALFGDLDLVTLRTRPPGRRTAPALHLPARRWKRVLALLRRRVARGGRAFVVCPRIGEDGERGGAVLLHRELSRALSPTARCALVHGRMPAAERRRVAESFRAGECDVLVGTTVLEVGVDVPDATVMVVVGAEHFGLATLHQLRGRVGRGRRRGVCILTGAENERVSAVCGTTDGFELAEEDLRIRGSGELLGTAQSGFSGLRALDPIEDLELLTRARQAVREEP